jgi:hypothetical protein
LAHALSIHSFVDGGMMSRISYMTWGLLLILIGVQLNLVESFVLSPQATSYWNKRWSGFGMDTVPGNYLAISNGYFRDSVITPRNIQITKNQLADNPYVTPSYQRPRFSGLPVYQSSYSNQLAALPSADLQKMITPPSWFCWPPIFLGSVLFLFGAARKQ